MTSRLNMSLRENKGLVYAIDAHYSAYTDTGLFSIYFGTEKSQVDKSITLIYKELKQLREKKIGGVQLQRLKEQLKGQLAMAEENNSSFMQMMGRSLLDTNHIESLDSILESIDQIQADELWHLSNEFLLEDQFSRLSYIPE